MNAPKKKIKKGTIIEEIILLFVTVVMLVPVYYFIIGAFKTRRDITIHPLTINAEMFTLSNFPYTVKKIKYFRSLSNTAFITVVALFIVVIAGSLAGFAIARLTGRIYQIYYKTLVALMVIPFMGCVLPLVVLSVKLGLYNSLWGCALIQAAWNMPFAVFLYTGFMKNIPKELEEAAYIDGCSTFGVYFRIFLPLLTPVTATCIIRQGIGIWNDYLVSNSLLTYSRTPTLMVSVYQFFGSRAAEYGYAFASIILASIPILIVFLFLQKYFIKGLAAGAVKS